MRVSKEQHYLELFRDHTGNYNATTIVHATMTNASAVWVWALFGLVGAAITGNVQQSTGFVLIEEGELFYYAVSGMGKRQKIDARRKIAFEQLERVRGVGGRKGMFQSLSIRWRNNNNRRINLIFGGMRKRHFPNQRENLNEIRKLISANHVEVKPDRHLHLT